MTCGTGSRSHLTSTIVQLPWLEPCEPPDGRLAADVVVVVACAVATCVVVGAVTAVDTVVVVVVVVVDVVAVVVVVDAGTADAPCDGATAAGLAVSAVAVLGVGAATNGTAWVDTSSGPFAELVDQAPTIPPKASVLEQPTIILARRAGCGRRGLFMRS